MIKIELGNYDRSYAKALLEKERPNEIIQALIFFLGKNQDQIYSDTCSLIRDLVIGPFDSPKNKIFNGLVDKSKVIKILERNILAGDYFQRSTSIYTLGKIGSRASIPTMKKSLVTLALKDPINGSDLISEIWWLYGSGKKNWKLIDIICELGFYQRWAGLHVLTHWNGRGEFGKQKNQYLKMFATDENPFIRVEAEYQLEEKKIKRKSVKEEIFNPSMPSWQPNIQFDTIRLQIGNELYKHGKREYRFKDLDKLLDPYLKQATKK